MWRFDGTIVVFIRRFVVYLLLSPSYICIILIGLAQPKGEKGIWETDRVACRSPLAMSLVNIIKYINHFNIIESALKVWLEWVKPNADAYIFHDI